MYWIRRQTVCSTSFRLGGNEVKALIVFLSCLCEVWTLECGDLRPASYNPLLFHNMIFPGQLHVVKDPFNKWKSRGVPGSNSSASALLVTRSVRGFEIVLFGLNRRF